MNTKYHYFIESVSLKKHEATLQQFYQCFFNTALFSYLEDKLIDGTEENSEDLTLYLNIPLNSSPILGNISLDTAIRLAFLYAFKALLNENIKENFFRTDSMTKSLITSKAFNDLRDQFYDLQNTTLQFYEKHQLFTESLYRRVNKQGLGYFDQFQIIFIGDRHDSTHSIEFLNNLIDQIKKQSTTVLLENVIGDGYEQVKKELEMMISDFDLINPHLPGRKKLLEILDNLKTREIYIMGGDNLFSNFINDTFGIFCRGQLGDFSYYMKIKSILEKKPDEKIIVHVGEKHIPGIMRNLLIDFPNITHIASSSTQNNSNYTYNEYVDSLQFLSFLVEEKPYRFNKFHFLNQLNKDTSPEMTQGSSKNTLLPGGE